MLQLSFYQRECEELQQKLQVSANQSQSQDSDSNANDKLKQKITMLENQIKEMKKENDELKSEINICKLNLLFFFYTFHAIRSFAPMYKTQTHTK